MAGYLGTKAVLLSTTAADVVGNAEIGGDLTVGGAFTSQGIDDNASATAMTLDASGNVGIGTSSPFAPLTVKNNPSFGIYSSFGYYSDNYPQLMFGTDASTASTGHIVSSTLVFNNSTSSEAMRIDSSGNLLVGKTSDSTVTVGCMARADGFLASYREDNAAALFGRANTDGDITLFRKGSSTVGSISVSDGDRLNINSGTVGLKLYDNARQILPSNGSGLNLDNAVDIGSSTARFDDIYATNGTIQTSDRNEKQDIEALSDAEQRVAVACKGLLRKFRWKDAVAGKGDDARIHFGIIAQDLQDAFAAEGLDAGRYAMFISSTWWETQTDVPAVEAVAEVLDEEGNVVTEAVEAKEAYTRTDTYETLEEAPEGATERTRLGVRYPELLAFIIGAM